MGPNGSGKSTLAQVLAGREGYTVTGGSVTYMGKDLLALEPDERAREGVFLAFQYPVEIPFNICLSSIFACKFFIDNIFLNPTLNFKP